MPKKVLIVGASGFVGSYLMKECLARCWEVIGTYSEHPKDGLIPLHMTDPLSAQQVLQQVKPEVVFLTAFNPNVEYCEVHPRETWAMNVQGNANVIEAAQKIGAKIVYFSSDYVFDGKSAPYREEDIPNPICEYGRQKLAVEKIIQGLPALHLIIRTAVVYGWEERGKNFFCHVLSTLNNGETMEVPTDQIRTPTLVDDLTEASCMLVEKNVTGIMHVAGPDRISRFDFARAIAEEFGLPMEKISPTTTQELGQTLIRPLDVSLDSITLYEVHGIKFHGVSEGVQLLHSTS